MATFYIQPESGNVQYQVEWADEIEDGVTITTSTWTITPVGPVLSSKGVSGTTTFLDISGLSTSVRDYTVVNTVTLSSGDIFSSSIFLLVEAT